MHYVYILKSIKDCQKRYVGITNDIERRLQQHNAEDSKNYSARYKPWTLETYIVYKDIDAARKFELYLKSHSGKVFLEKHFMGIDLP